MSEAHSATTVAPCLSVEELAAVSAQQDHFHDSHVAEIEQMKLTFEDDEDGAANSAHRDQDAARIARVERKVDALNGEIRAVKASVDELASLLRSSLGSKPPPRVEKQIGGATTAAIQVAHVNLDDTCDKITSDLFGSVP